MTLISLRLKIEALGVDYKTRTGHLVVIGIVELEGNTILVRHTDALPYY